MGEFARPALTVVVATKDRPELLARCLESVRATLGPADELVVVDSASRDDRTRSVATSAGARVVRADRPGTSLARNLGWQAATHDCVAFTDDDVLVDTGWADAMARALGSGAPWVTGWIGVRNPTGGATEFNPTMLRDAPAVLDRTHRGSMGASANFGAHCDLLREVGGFDERFGPGTWTSAAEDVELFDRLLAAGAVGRYDPAVRVFHEHWRSRRDAVVLNWRYGKGMGARLARLSRREPRRAATAAYDVLWSEGLAAAGRCLRARYELGVVMALMRVTGTLAGFLAWVARR